MASLPRMLRPDGGKEESGLQHDNLFSSFTDGTARENELLLQLRLVTTRFFPMNIEGGLSGRPQSDCLLYANYRYF
jgi:hypothetical protein